MKENDVEEVFSNWIGKCTPNEYSLWSLRDIYLDYMVYANKGVDVSYIVKTVNDNKDDYFWEPCGLLTGKTSYDVGVGLVDAGFKQLSIPDERSMFFVKLPRMGRQYSQNTFVFIEYDAFYRWLKLCSPSTRDREVVSVQEAYVTYMAYVNRDLDSQFVVDICNLKSNIPNWQPRDDNLRGLTKHAFITLMEESNFKRYFMSNGYVNGNMFYIKLP